MSSNPRLPWLLVLPTILLLLALAAAESDRPRQPAGVARPERKAQAAFASLPLHFEANRGQAAKDVRFVARGGGCATSLTADGATFELPNPVGRGAGPGGRKTPGAAPASVVRMRLAGAGRRVRPLGERPLRGRVNYRIGNDPARWQRDVPIYAGVRYRQVYPGIDLTYYGRRQVLEYDFVVAPGADPAEIALEFYGQDRAEIDSRGDLLLHTPNGVLAHRRPVAYQEVNGSRRRVEGAYVVRHPSSVKCQASSVNRRECSPAPVQVALQLGPYDRSRPLVIDPAAVSRAALVGSDGFTAATSIALGRGGDVYLVGYVTGGGLPTTPGAPQPAPPGGSDDLFIARFAPDGSELRYLTYFGGSGSEVPAFTRVHGPDVAAASDGSAWVVGTTNSPDLPTTQNAVQPVRPLGGLERNEDGFVLQLSASGTQIRYSSYLGGAGAEEVEGDIPREINGDDGACGVVVDRLDDTVYITGQTGSTRFAGLQADINVLRDNQGHAQATLPDAFVVSIDPLLGYRVDGYQLGGGLEPLSRTAGLSSGLDIDVARDPQTFGKVLYVVGQTACRDDPQTAVDEGFPTTEGAFQTGPAGDLDVFVTRSPVGAQPRYTTLLGGSRLDGRSPAFLLRMGIAADAAGNFYVTGMTESPDFPTPNGIFSQLGGLGDAFVTRFNPTGGVVYSTLLGGSSTDRASGIAVNGAGEAYVAGESGSSADFPLVNEIPLAKGGIDPPGAGAFVARLTADGSVLRLSTTLGGVPSFASGIVLDPLSGAPIICGFTDPQIPADQAFFYGPVQASAIGNAMFAVIVEEGPAPPGRMVVTPKRLMYRTPAGTFQIRAFQVRNRGRGPLRVMPELSSSEGPFSYLGDPILEVPPGETRFAEFRFSPQQVGRQESRVTFRSNDPRGRPVVGTLVGKATRPRQM